MMNRKNFVLGGSSVLGLPFLESFAEAKKTPSKKLIFLGGGFGFTDHTFYPTEAGKFSKIGLTEGLKPLSKYRDQMTMVSNLTNHGATNPHGGSTSYLTGANVAGTPGKRFYNSISVDQLAAKHLGESTRYASLVLSSSKDTLVGDFGHGKGYSLSWDKNGKPIPGIESPLKLYQKIFSSDLESPEEIKTRIAHERSLLDIVKLDAKLVKTKLSKLDQDRIDQYFTSMREIERELAIEAKWSQTPKPQATVQEPNKDLKGEKQIRTMLDLLALALQNNSTNIASYRFPVDPLLKSMGINISAHNLSHYHKHEQRTNMSRKRDEKITELFGYFLDRLKGASYGESNLFDTSIVSFGTNLRSGHLLKSLPCILAGGGIDNIRKGEHIKLKKVDTPLANLWLSLLHQMNVPVEKFSHSHGTLDEIFV